MTSLQIQQIPYQLPFKTPLQLAFGTLQKRWGSWLQITDPSGLIGLGDIAPFPGLHRETIQQARQQAQQLPPRSIEELLRDILQHQNPQLLTQIETWNLYPSVRMGLEMAILSLLTQHLAQPLSHLLQLVTTPSIAPMTRGQHRAQPLSYLHQPHPITHVPIQALLLGTTQDLPQQIQLAQDNGITTLKLKVGRKPINEDIERVQVVQKAMDVGVRLRLDANRAWTLEEAVEFGHGVNSVPIEFIEEPLQDSAQLPKFFRETQLPYALDESLPTRTPGTLPHEREGLHTLILKPTLFGGWFASLPWIQAAQIHGLGLVISSTFESPVGRSFLVHFAAACHPPDQAAGLDTGKWFVKDPLQNPHWLKQGCYITQALPFPFPLPERNKANSGKNRLDDERGTSSCKEDDKNDPSIVGEQTKR